MTLDPTYPSLHEARGIDPGEGPYRVWPRAARRLGDLTIRAVAPSDIEAIRQWRNAQMAVLRQSSEIGPEAQRAYFDTHVWPQKLSAHPRQILFAIERDERLIGYGGLVHIDWEAARAEVSFLLDETLEAQPALRAEVFTGFLQLMQSVAFDDLRINRLFTETYNTRARHIETLESTGFSLEGTLREHVIIDGRRVDSLIHSIIASDR